MTWRKLVLPTQELKKNWILTAIPKLHWEGESLIQLWSLENDYIKLGKIIMGFLWLTCAGFIQKKETTQRNIHVLSWCNVAKQGSDHSLFHAV